MLSESFLTVGFEGVLATIFQIVAVFAFAVRTIERILLQDYRAGVRIVESSSDWIDFVTSIGPRRPPRKPPDKSNDTISPFNIRSLFDC